MNTFCCFFDLIRGAPIIFLAKKQENYQKVINTALLKTFCEDFLEIGKI